MKKIVSYLTIICLLLITFSCGGGGSSKGVSSVTISASFKINSITGLKAAASTLTSIRYTVSGPDMEVMSGTVPVTGNLVEFTLNVPNGPQRHFVIEALDSSNTVKYAGNAYKDLDGTPIIIDINLVQAGLLSPVGLTAVAVSTSQINLSWSAPAGNLPITGYKINRNGVQIAIVAGTASTYTDVGLSPNTTYCYTVTAFNASTESTQSNQACAVTTPDTIPPSVPTNLTAAPFSATQIDLSWNPSTDNVAMAGFKVYDSNGTFLKTVTANAASITGLSPDAQYCFTVSAYDTSGNESGKSSQACAKTLISGGSDTTPPSIPTNFTATTVSATQIDMSWNPSTDNIAMAGYKVYDYFGGAYLKSVTMTFTSFTGLSPDTQYCFTVSAYDTSGNESGKSSQACATTTTCLTGTWTSIDLPYISMTLNQVASTVTGNWVNSNTGCAYTGSGSYNSSTTFLTITFTTGMNPVQCCQSFTYNGTVSNCNSMSLGWTNNCSFSGGRQY